MRLLLATLLLMLLPSLGSGQSAALPVPELAQPTDARQSPIDWWIGTRDAASSDEGVSAALPLWSTPDGRVLAIVALAGSHGAPALPQSPQVGSAVDWRLVDVTNFVSGGLSYTLSNNATAYAKFGRGIILAPMFAPECASGIDACALQPAGSSGATAIGTMLHGDEMDLDVSYGLSWLRLSDQPGMPHQPVDLFTGIGGGAVPTLLIPGFTLANVQSSTIAAQTRWRLDGTQSIDLGAALSRIQYELPGMPLPPVWNQAALTLGLHRGDFSGLIVGRVLGPTDAISGGQHWSSIDLGISWRAPWRGVFSVGAQNVWSSGYVPNLTDPGAAREADPSQARVPYVQYHQDL